MLVGVEVNVGVGDGVVVGVSVTVGVWVQVGAERIGPETPRTRVTRNRSTIPSLSAFKLIEGQMLLSMGRNSGC